MERALAGTGRSWSPAPNVDLSALFKQKVDGLEAALGLNASIRIEAAAVLRTMIDRIVLHPGRQRGRMSIEVQGDPGTLFLMAQGKDASIDDRMITVVAEEGLEPPTHGL
ncbi:MAG: hypothetical protein ACRED5_12945 [Propylenella sp.]